MGGHHLVMRQGQPVALQILLQAGLGILAQLGRVGAVEQGGVQPFDHLRGRVEARFEIDGPQQGLDRIGQDGRPLVPATAALALAEDQRIGHAERAGDVMERILLDQIGPQA